MSELPTQIGKEEKAGDSKRDGKPSSKTVDELTNEVTDNAQSHETLEDLVLLLKEQIRGSDFIQQNPPKGESIWKDSD